MYYSTLFIATAAVFGLASAQNYSTSGPITVDPNSVPLVLRQSWCRGQTGNCPLICGGQAFPNTCDPNDLTYNCVCTDGSKPNISAYDATLPSFVCQQWVADCVDAHPNDLEGQTACRSVICGMKNASAVEQTSSGNGRSSSSAAPSSTSSSASGGGSPTGTGTGAAQSASDTGAAVALSLGKSYGTGALAVGMAAVFGFVL